MRRPSGLRPPRRREVMVCFDFEGTWGMPGQAAYDLAAATDLLLERLAAHGVSAVFFVVGELALAEPEVIAAIARAGHEIGLHGYRHERFIELDDEQMADALAGIGRAAAEVERLAGVRPVGFRAPYLLSPRYRDPRLSAGLRGLGFRWISHCEIHQPVVHARPHAIGTSRVLELLARHPGVLDGWFGRGLTAVRNWRLVVLRRPLGSRLRSLRWVLAGCPPFTEDGFVEFPLTAPLDCTAIGLPGPERATDDSDMAFGRFALERALAGRGGLATLTFHDWLITGANRPELFDTVLASIRRRGLRSVHGADVMERYLSAGGGPAG